jgi:hypothetical protein
MNLVWHLTPGHEDETANALKGEGVKVRGGLGFEPITTIATVLAVTSLVKVLIKLYKDNRYKGVIIDATKDPAEIKEMPGWPSQQVLVLTAEGAKFFSGGADASAADELGKIAQLLGKH